MDPIETSINFQDADPNRWQAMAHRTESAHLKYTVAQVFDLVAVAG
jgi:hypothetical protein